MQYYVERKLRNFMMIRYKLIATSLLFSFQEKNIPFFRPSAMFSAYVTLAAFSSLSRHLVCVCVCGRPASLFSWPLDFIYIITMLSYLSFILSHPSITSHFLISNSNFTCLQLSYDSLTLPTACKALVLYMICGTDCSNHASTSLVSVNASHSSSILSIWIITCHKSLDKLMTQFLCVLA